MKPTKHQQNVLLCISFSLIVSVPFIWFWYITTEKVQHNEREVQIQPNYETNEGHDPVVLTYSCCQATGTLSHCPKHKLKGTEVENGKNR